MTHVGVAFAAIPLTLPAGESPTDWQAPARIAGFTLVPNASDGGVRVVAVASGWEIRVREADGTERAVPVAVPRTPREREDLLWLAASLAAPLNADALDVPQPPRPAVTVPAPPPKVATAPAPAAARPKARPVTPPVTPSVTAEPASTAPPAVEPAPAPVATEPAPTVPPPVPPTVVPPTVVPPADAELPVSPASSGGALRLVLLTGLDAADAIDPDRALPEIGLRSDLWVGATVGSAVLGLDAALLSPTALATLGDTERMTRWELAAELGLGLGPAQRIVAAGRVGIGFLGFSSGDPPERLGGLRVGVLGVRVVGGRPLRTDLDLVVAVGLDRDLSAVVLDKAGEATTLALPRTRGLLEVGISWNP